MTKIILVRHGHVEGISPERFRGRADLALTPEGLRQAEATARRIEASWTPAALYASPLSRCRTTAEAIGRPFGLTPTPVPGLVDIDYGEWQGLTPDEVGRKMARAARHLVPGAALGGDPGWREPAGCPRSRSRGIAGGDRAASDRKRSWWSGTTASIASSCCTRSIFRCRVIGGSAKIPVRSTRSTSRRASLLFDRSTRPII